MSGKMKCAILMLGSILINCRGSAVRIHLVLMRSRESLAELLSRGIKERMAGGEQVNVRR